MVNILLLCGGGGTEHDISLLSAKYIYEQLSPIKDFNIFHVEIGRDKIRRTAEGIPCELRKSGELVIHKKSPEHHYLHFAIPCIHGPPGENGQIQAVFELMELPYLGANSEASLLCFNKVSTKLWLEALGVPTTPFCFLSSNDNANKEKARQFFQAAQDVFVKAASQGSSVGCYHVEKIDDLEAAIEQAFTYSDYVLVEKALIGRELEVACYEYQGQTIATLPGEIVCPDKFYNFEQKYSSTSKAQTLTIAPNINTEVEKHITALALKSFQGLKLRHLARIDFFLTENDQVYLNEVNTFPGHTAISMFPKMMINHGHPYQQFIEDIIRDLKRD